MLAQIRQNWQIYNLALCIFFLPIHSLISTWLIYPLILAFIFALTKQSYYQELRKYKVIFIPTLLVLLALFSAFYFNFSADSAFEFQKRLGFIIFPLIMTAFAEKITLSKILLINHFLFIGILLSLVWSLYNYYELTQVQEVVHWKEGPDVNKILLTERPYMGLFIVICFITYLTLFSQQFSNKFLLIGQMLTLTISLFVLNARMAFVTIVFLICLLSLITLLNKRNYLVLFFSIVTLIISGFVVVKQNLIPSRLHPSFLFKNEPRMLIWPCTFDSFQNKEYNWWSGLVGYKQADNMLLECYKGHYIRKTRWKWVHPNNYYWNTHSEYLNHLLSFGVIGLLSILIILSIPLMLAYRYKSYLLGFIILAFSIMFITENILARQMGIFFFNIYYILSIVATLRIKNGDHTRS